MSRSRHSYRPEQGHGLPHDPLNAIIGPRPIVDSEIEKYGLQFELYKSVRPGISGLWQVSGRNNTTYAERVRLDNYYVRNWSVWLDLHIIARTVRVVLTGEGAY